MLRILIKLSDTLHRSSTLWDQIQMPLQTNNWTNHSGTSLTSVLHEQRGSGSLNVRQASPLTFSSRPLPLSILLPSHFSRDHTAATHSLKELLLCIHIGFFPPRWVPHTCPGQTFGFHQSAELLPSHDQTQFHDMELGSSIHPWSFLQCTCQWFQILAAWCTLPSTLTGVSRSLQSHYGCSV